MERPTMKENLKGYSLEEVHKLYTDCPELYRHIVNLDKYIDNLEDELNRSNKQAEKKPYTIHDFMWRFSSVILIPIVFFVLLVIRPIKWLFTGHYYPKNPQKVKKTWLYKWILKTGLGWFH